MYNRTNAYLKSQRLPYRCYGISEMRNVIYLTPISFTPPGLTDIQREGVIDAARVDCKIRHPFPRISFTEPPMNLALILEELAAQKKKYP